jgi:hypothetical protein
MQVLLDGHPILATGPRLSDALEAASSNARSRGRVIVEVKIDGVVLSNDKLGNLKQDMSAVRELSMLSAEPRALVRHALLDAVAVVESGQAQQALAAELIQAGKPEDSLEPLRLAMATWQAVRDTVERGAALLELDLQNLALPGLEEGLTLQTAVKDLLGHLAQMREALQKQDWSAVSDIVGYDLDAQSGVWKGLLVALSQHVATLPPVVPKAGPE